MKLAAIISHAGRDHPGRRFAWCHSIDSRPRWFYRRGMKGIFCLGALGLAALICGCNKSTQPGPAASSAPVRWEYSSFSFHEPDFKMLPGKMMVCYVEFSQGEGVWSGSNNVHKADSVLNQVADHGWELAWTDGRQFIVKRPAGAFTNGAFIVAEAMLPAGR
jgi:hypothetical protein